jgi:type IV pilus assembly protein PilM
MISLYPKKRFSPIGIDIGSRSVKLCQVTADHGRIVAVSRWDLPPNSRGESSSPERRPEEIVEAVRQAREGHAFRGRDAVLCLSHQQLFLQNMRLPRSSPAEMERAVHQEAAGRIPFPLEEAEIRYLEAAEIRNGNEILREVILLACRRPVLERALQIVEQAGLCPVAVDVEPSALTRCHANQSRRAADQGQRNMILHMGSSCTAVLIVQGERLLFIKYVPLGGLEFDKAVARSLGMDAVEAATLRRHNGDRRSDRQDPEIARSVSEALRPVIARLASEVAMCVRYHSVTFRGQPLARLVLGGGEATPELAESLQGKLGIACQVSDPFRSLSQNSVRGRAGQWDVAAGLALRPLNRNET